MTKTSAKAQRLSLKLETIRKELETLIATHSQTSDDAIGEALDWMQDAEDQLQGAIDVLDDNTGDEFDIDMDTQRTLNRERD